MGRWWPDLELTVVEDRAEAGVRWTVTGPIEGTMEVWCEPVMDGFVLHYFLHGEPREHSRVGRAHSTMNWPRRIAAGGRRAK